ncbi:cyclic nucleotide-binding domain-containing protein [Oleomonas cavernae]|nr:cyclic nucleotide-binding domain-containing protein [Oleomonas cavernae]
MEAVVETCTLIDDVPIFAELDAAAKATIVDRADWYSLPGGQVLFRQGDPGDALYVLLRGSLGVLRDGAGAVRQRIGWVRPGEVVGEMALLSGRARSATVLAERDSEVLRLDQAAFQSLVATHPQAMLRVTRQIVWRLEGAQAPTLSTIPTRPRTVAILPLGGVADCTTLRRDLARGLRLFGTVAEIGEAAGGQQQTAWFHDIEAGHDFVLYEADDTAGPWSQLCLRQADMVLVLAAADARDARQRHPMEMTAHARGLPLELVLMHPPTAFRPREPRPSSAGAWRGCIITCASGSGATRHGWPGNWRGAQWAWSCRVAARAASPTWACCAPWPRPGCRSTWSAAARWVPSSGPVPP